MEETKREDVLKDIEDVKESINILDKMVTVLNAVKPVLEDEPQVSHLEEIINYESKKVIDKVKDISEKCENN